MRATKRAAFTVVEVVIGLAIVAILSAIILGAASGYMRESKISDTASALKDLGTSIRNFKNTVGNYPARLSDLSTAILSTDKTSCSTANPTVVTFGATNAAKWPKAGPFYWRAIPRTGIQLPLGATSDGLVRTSTNTSAGYLQIKIFGVRLTDARELNRQLDGTPDADAPDGSNSTGSVQWSVPTGDVVDVTYNVPIGTTC